MMVEETKNNNNNRRIMTTHDDCIFCNYQETFKDRIIMDNSNWVAAYDKYPVSDGHVLIFPKRHCENYFKMKLTESMTLFPFIKRIKHALDLLFEPDGYNLGINNGDAAGQTINHCHIHLIPRYKGDVQNPRGGVRGVIPNKQDYKD